MTVEKYLCFYLIEFNRVSLEIEEAAAQICNGTGTDEEKSCSPIVAYGVKIKIG